MYGIDEYVHSFRRGGPIFEYVGHVLGVVLTGWINRIPSHEIPILGYEECRGRCSPQLKLETWQTARRFHERKVCLEGKNSWNEYEERMLRVRNPVVMWHQDRPHRRSLRTLKFDHAIMMRADHWPYNVRSESETE